MKTLVIGSSTNSERYSYKAIVSLRNHHYEVLAHGIKEGSVADVTISTEWPSSIDIDTVTLYVGPQNQAEYIPKILALKPRRIIFNPGTENPSFEEIANKEGIHCEVACTLVLLATDQY
jgi:predicted CoA-binding protein